MSFRPQIRRLILIAVFLGFSSYCTIPDVCASSKEIDRDGRFIAYANGTVLDTSTGLMWASNDNGEAINWNDAKKYCDNFLGGWYTDWRLPTLDELAEIYDTGPGYMQECCFSCSRLKITELIKLSCACIWSGETDGDGAAHFVFRDGFRGWNFQPNYGINRVLPVRDPNGTNEFSGVINREYDDLRGFLNILESKDGAKKNKSQTIKEGK